ncbi:hypothetical protein JVU11DRAFT_8629 [Chiua virens]|nr:hypothetical protein JVU11DRAFT_8629 [Chiua virens]
MNDDSDRELGERQRHGTLYFNDGNVVLLAPRAGKSGLLFRVHKSVLCSHSPVFADMFDFCTPSGGTGDHVYDGVPLIRMMDDADHLALILKILYYQSSLPWTPHDAYPTFEVITSFLELSRKYGIDRMDTEVRAHLESDWPQTLHEWDKLEKAVETMETELGHRKFKMNPVTGPPPRRLLDDYFPEPASAIRLARRFEIPRILPAAFYHLSRLEISDDWEKNRANPSYLSTTKRNARWGLLDTEDFRCLLYGRAAFRKAIFRHGYGLTGEKHDIDPGPVPDEFMDSDLFFCDGGMKVWQNVADRCSQSADPLALLKTFDFAKLGGAEFCRSVCGGGKVYNSSSAKEDLGTAGRAVPPRGRITRMSRGSRKKMIHASTLFLSSYFCSRLMFDNFKTTIMRLMPL